MPPKLADILTDIEKGSASMGSEKEETEDEVDQSRGENIVEEDGEVDNKLDTIVYKDDLDDF